MFGEDFGAKAGRITGGLTPSAWVLVPAAADFSAAIIVFARAALLALSTRAASGFLLAVVGALFEIGASWRMLDAWLSSC